MTFGIDISGGQVGLDLGRARSEGVEFVISKAVAAYLPGHTVADGYHANIDRTIAAGIAKGHYLVPNSANTPEASAEFMAANLYRRSVQDVLALDNEPLDRYAVYWSDAQAARFFRRLNALTDHPFDRMWLYCPASLTRANGPWPECAALGIKFWWSAYGSYPTVQTPDHVPSLQGSIPRWDVHQYSSAVWVAGKQVDGNYSPHPVGALFGGTMPNSLQGVIDYARNHPLRDGGTWSNWCASFVYRAGGFSQPFPSAMAAGDNAGGLNPNWQGAPAGAIHYWAGVGGDGHCAFELGGGLLLMASSSVTDRWGTAMGTVSFSTYARMGIPYRGWSMRWGNETLSGSSAAGGGTSPIEEDDMYSDADRARDVQAAADAAAAKYGVFYGGNWKNSDGSLQAASYGVLPIAIRNQVLIGQTVGLVNGLAAAVAQLASGGGVEIDLEAIKAAAAEGASSGTGVDIAELASLIASKLPADADAEAIAEAVREKFRTEPLS